jgi:hypothetical protein
MKVECELKLNLCTSSSNFIEVTKQQKPSPKIWMRFAPQNTHKIRTIQRNAVYTAKKHKKVRYIPQKKLELCGIYRIFFRQKMLFLYL